MEVAMIESSPFQREVREWQRVDPNTGALLTGRLEADRWNNGSDNKYGKVIDSQNVSTPNGTQLSQRKELEVLQARTTAGSLQVVRSSTIQTSSSRRSILSMGGNDTNATTSNDNRSLSNMSSLMNNKISSNSLFKSDWNGEKSPLGYERGRSASTEDVTLDHLRANSSDSDDDEPMEWRRVSKIRRSLQHPKSAPKFSTRPTDLPKNLVNISKIKRDFENGFSSSFLKPINLELGSPGSDSNSQCEGKSESSCKSVKKASFITADSLRDIRGKLKRLSDESLYKDDILASPAESSNSNTSINDAINTFTPSLHNADSNVKYRETSSVSSDWHSRRKSYGFENMTSKINEISKMESSTDSGLGRSGDIWPSTESSKPRGTIITLGDNEASSSVLLNRDTSFGEQRLSPSENGYENKRHSIAVEETKYVKDSKTLVNLNGLNAKEWNSSSGNLLDENGRRMKRVEFCKTEVHFAAESGRVNIVETDGKPPSTNNFRRRRRISAPNAPLDTERIGPLMHFGDEKLLDRNIDKVIENEVKVLTMDQLRVDDINTTAREDDDDLDEISLRGILKNKPVKPRPYHLGENIENSQKLWGVRLKPTGTDLIKSNGVGNDEGDGCIFSRNEPKDELKPIPGFSTKVKLNSNSTLNFSWENKILDTVSLNHSRSPSHDNSPQPIKSPLLSHSESNDLKSTSLIMKTIKSANQFDEAMKSLATCNRNSLTPEKQSSKSCDHEFGLGSSFKLVSSLSSSKSSSSSSILYEDFAKEDGIASNKINYENDSSPKSMRSYRNSDDVPDLRKPIAAPRIKKIGPATGLSLQLSQLRRIYEAADQSTENGVREYDIGDNNLSVNKDQPDEYTTELSGSWSRMKARRNLIKQQHQQYGLSEENFTDEITNSNKMSIILHSPIEGNKKIEIPIARPRTNIFIPDKECEKKATDYDSEPSPFKRDGPRKNFTTNFIDKQILSKNESFKPANGARKLKEHELSYFGLNVTAASKISNELPKSNRNDGKLNSDKPDLLINHSPNVERTPKSPKSTINKSKILTDDTNNPIYENLKGYDRKLDLQRDEMILKELNEAADEVVKEAILKRSEKEKSPKRHRSSKPFATIEEEKEKNPKKVMESKAVQVSRGFNEILTRIKPLRQPSSASSSESVSSTGRTRTRQLSHKSTSRTSSENQSPRDSSKCSRHNGHSSRDGHLRSSNGSRSSRQTNSSSHENSVEDIRAVVVAPRRSRRSNGSNESSNERESHKRPERKHDHKRTSSSSRTANGEKVSGSRSSHQTKEVSSKDKVKSSNNESEKRLHKPSVTTTTTTYVLQQSYMIPPPRKKRRLRYVSRSSTFTNRNIKNRKRQKLLGTCICS
ncbi:hypothetical protein Bhyg_01670 [Pseudolycoriella hygida]|uniref:Uncharacterized protein n=1 Tax=Pseudolycoriella hygida TaxID=35572 RepID=A0A9Q0NBT9_9DIPT|nr:hypothetical protein Bhyg_01670 [Pseudolycoriella hygida]